MTDELRTLAGERGIEVMEAEWEEEEEDGGGRCIIEL